MKIILESDGTKFGPVDGISAKSLDNPHRDKSLRYLTGLDQRVREDVLSSTRAELVLRIIVQDALKNGRAVVYCHSGRHRSVALVEVAGERLRNLGHEVEIIHRRRSAWGR